MTTTKDHSKSRDFLSKFVVHNKYSNFLTDEKRRQNWEECVTTLKQMYLKRYPHLRDEIEENFRYVYDKKVLPSMRSIQFGGIPIEFAPNRIYNCAYVAVDHEFVFAEIMFLLLGGTGVGYSVQKRHTDKLPSVKKPDGERRFLIGDSIEGWSDSIRQLVYAYLRGKPFPRFDYRDIRPEGSLIRKTGGRAPGHKGLKECHENMNRVLKGAIGRKLKPIEVHDLVCYIADCILAGGVREAALISLFDKDDEEMVNCKRSFKSLGIEDIEEKTSGWAVQVRIPETTTYREQEDGSTEIFMSKQFGDHDIKNLEENGLIPWYYVHPQRGRANNSAVLKRGDTTEQEFMQVWEQTRQSGSGEPGIFWTNDEDIGTNPCGEISLKSCQFCNLTSIVVFDVESQRELNKRARVASFLGTLQASYTDFHYLRRKWRDNTREDALLGVSMTGIASGNILDLDVEQAAKEATEENARVTDKIEINKASRVTCIKPEGCRPWYGLVTTDKGIKTLEELFYGHDPSKEWCEYEGDEQVIQDGGQNRMQATYNNGRDSVFSIKLSMGFELHSTANHQWFIDKHYDRSKKEKYTSVESFVRTDKLSLGDIVKIEMNNYDGETFEMKSLKRYDTSWMRKEQDSIAFPSEMNPDLAWLLGYIWGDGYIKHYSNTIRFIDEHTYNLDKVKRILEEQFGVIVDYKPCKSKKAYEMSFSNVDLINWLGQNGVHKSNKQSEDSKIIPECIRCSTKEDIIAFIAGLGDADGCVSVHKDRKEVKQFGICQADSLFIHHLQHVSLSVGLVFGVNIKGENFQSEKSITNLSLTSHSDKKSTTLLNKHSNKAEKYDRPFTNREDSNPQRIMGKVLEVEYVGEMKTFDVKVENKHYFYDGSFKSHNSGTLAAGVVGNGIHPIYGRYFIRNIRISKSDPIYDYLRVKMPGFVEDEFTRPDEKAVVSIPIKAPEDAIFRDEGAQSLLSRVKRFFEEWVKPGFREGTNQHNISATIYVKDEEWDDVTQWMWNNRNCYNGITVLPHTGGNFQQAPYQEISEEQYNELISKFPSQEEIDFTEVTEEFNTKNFTQEAACSGGECHITEM